MLKVGLVIPTLNGGDEFKSLVDSIRLQHTQPMHILVIDSGSIDGTPETAKAAGATVVRIAKSEFNHGGTRMFGVRHLENDCEIVVFLTQDAILADQYALGNLISVFDDKSVSVAYGRQLPRSEAGPIETFARLHNYPTNSETRSMADVPSLGFKACFCSNSFAGYRISDLSRNGGFPDNVIFGEDALAVASIVQHGGSIRYEATAAVIHSHRYSLVQEFKRYFDIGVMHYRAADLLSAFGTPQGAGRAFVTAEQRFLIRNAPLFIPEALLRTMIKYIAYKLGLRESSFPIEIKRKISMNRGFWK